MSGGGARPSQIVMENPGVPGAGNGPTFRKALMHALFKGLEWPARCTFPRAGNAEYTLSSSKKFERRLCFRLGRDT